MTSIKGVVYVMINSKVEPVTSKTVYVGANSTSYWLRGQWRRREENNLKISGKNYSHITRYDLQRIVGFVCLPKVSLQSKLMSIFHVQYKWLILYTVCLNCEARPPTRVLRFHPLFQSVSALRPSTRGSIVMIIPLRNIIFSS